MNKVVLSLLLMGLLVSTQASLIGPTQVAQGGNSNPSTEAGIVGDFLGYNVTYLGKFEPEGNDDPLGLIASGKIQWQGLSGGDDNSSKVSWNFGNTCWVLDAVAVKAGREYLNVYTVSADQLKASGGWQELLAPQGKGISHISFFGTCQKVPETGSTAMLLSAGLAGLAVLRRRLTK